MSINNSRVTEEYMILMVSPLKRHSALGAQEQSGINPRCAHAATQIQSTVCEGSWAQLIEVFKRAFRH